MRSMEAQNIGSPILPISSGCFIMSETRILSDMSLHYSVLPSRPIEAILKQSSSWEASRGTFIRCFKSRNVLSKTSMGQTRGLSSRNFKAWRMQVSLTTFWTIIRLDGAILARQSNTKLSDLMSYPPWSSLPIISWLIAIKTGLFWCFISFTSSSLDIKLPSD